MFSNNNDMLRGTVQTKPEYKWNLNGPNCLLKCTVNI